MKFHVFRGLITYRISFFYFHSIPVSEGSIETTVFIMAEGQFEILIMNFGLKNAISIFQRAIMNALGDLAHDYVTVYVDDILIVSPDL